MGMDREKREELATATRLKLQSSGWKASTAFDRNGGGGERLERGWFRMKERQQFSFYNITDIDRV